MIAEEFVYFRGRVGLYHILRLLGVREGDEVILQAFTCIAVPEAITALGAIPVWVDTAPGSVNMDPADLRAKITTKTRAILVQHTFGIPAEVDAIKAAAVGLGIPLIEDCCHAFASTYKGQVLGSLGNAAFWSYEWGKPVIAGIGGGVVFNRGFDLAAARADYARSFAPPPRKKSLVIRAQYHLHGILYAPTRYWSVRKAFRALGKAGVAQSNYNPVRPGRRADDFGWTMAAFSRGKLSGARKAAERFLPERKLQAERYLGGLSPARVVLPSVPEGGVAVYSRFPILVKDKEALLAKAAEANLEIANWFSTPVHPLEGADLRLVNYEPGCCPNAESLTKTLVSLPVTPKSSAAFQEKLIRLINGF